jgi:hypothetical protein
MVVKRWPRVAGHEQSINKRLSPPPYKERPLAVADSLSYNIPEGVHLDLMASLRILGSTESV